MSELEQAEIRIGDDGTWWQKIFVRQPDGSIQSFLLTVVGRQQPLERFVFDSIDELDAYLED